VFVIAAASEPIQSPAKMTKLLLLVLLLLASCSDDRAPLPSAEEADQLNEAEALLNETAEQNSGG
jgi:hypothetical protein